MILFLNLYWFKTPTYLYIFKDFALDLCGLYFWLYNYNIYFCCSDTLFIYLIYSYNFLIKFYIIIKNWLLLLIVYNNGCSKYIMRSWVYVIYGLLDKKIKMNIYKVTNIMFYKTRSVIGLSVTYSKKSGILMEDLISCTQKINTSIEKIRTAIYEEVYILETNFRKMPRDIKFLISKFLITEDPREFYIRNLKTEKIIRRILQKKIWW